MAMMTCPHCGNYTYPKKYIINEKDGVTVIHSCQFCNVEVKTEHFKNRTCPKCRNKTLRYKGRVGIVGFDWDDCIWQCSNCGYNIIAKPKGRLPKMPEIKLSIE